MSAVLAVARWLVPPVPAVKSRLVGDGEERNLETKRERRYRKTILRSRSRSHSSLVSGWERGFDGRGVESRSSRGRGEAREVVGVGIGIDTG